MEEDLHKEGIEKYYKERLEKIYYSTRKNILSEIAYPFKNLLLGRKFNLRLYAYSSSDRLRTLINCQKPIINPIFSPTLLQIYCIKLIGPISYSFWVWATICDLTIGVVCGKKISASKVYNGYGGFRTTPDQSTPCRIS